MRSGETVSLSCFSLEIASPLFPRVVSTLDERSPPALDFLKFIEDQPKAIDIGRRVKERKSSEALRRSRSIGRALAMSLLLFAPAGIAAVPVRAHIVSGARAFMQPGKITDPKAAATRLYNAWRRKNRVAASKVADQETIDRLFGVRWRAMQSKGCRLRDAGGFQCIYYDAGNSLSLSINVAGGASAGYMVESVSFSTGE